MTTSFTPRRHPKLKAAGLVAWGVTATIVAVYFAQTVRIPDRVCVSAARPHAVPGPAPVHRAGISSPAAGQEAPSVPDVSLSGVSWRPYNGVDLPVSKQAGPHDTSGGLASGYADSPAGAVLAAVNIAARTSWQFGPQVFGPTITRQVTGTFAARMRSGDQNAWDQGAPESAAGTQGTREAAFAIDSYAPSGATVEIVSAAPGAGADAVTQVQVVWQRGDWRVVAPPGGDWADSATQVSPAAAGFTPFPGQGA